jgi:FtsH-binding integral membrane protein
VAMATFHTDTKNYIKSNPRLSFIANTITLGTFIAFSCCENLRRKSPCNYILLVVFILVEILLLAVSVLRYYPEEVLLAFGLTILICFALIIFTFWTIIDFTAMGGFLIVVFIILLVASFIVATFNNHIII